MTTIFKKNYCLFILLNLIKKEHNKYRAIYINRVKVIYCLKIYVSVLWWCLYPECWINAITAYFDTNT